jgi:hypothetical protein
MRIAIDYEEVLWAGLEAYYTGRDLYEAAFQLVEDLKGWQGGETRRRLMDRLSYAEAVSCREHGLCPHCGRDLEQSVEGFGVDGGSRSIHRQAVMICPGCDS